MKKDILQDNVVQQKRTTRKIPKKLRYIYSLDDFDIFARKKLPRQIYGYYSGAAETNQSLKYNRDIFQNYFFVPRILRDVSKRSTQHSLFGKKYKYPFGIAPMGLSALATWQGDIQLCRAANKQNIPMVLSATSLIKLEKLGKEEDCKWFQLYLPGEDNRILQMLERVKASGFENIVLTVDLPVTANRENNEKTGFSTPLKPNFRLAWDGITHPVWSIQTFLRSFCNGVPHFENMDYFRGPPIISRNFERARGARDQLNWKHVELIRKNWKGNFIVKGILSAEDAIKAKESGVDAVWISNHGGRQLDGSVSPVSVLPKIRKVVGDYPIIIDSGFRRGSDILKALALGADFVFVGRPFLYAAAVDGEQGIEHAIKLLGDEVERNIAMLGVNNLDEMNADFLAVRDGVSSNQV